MIHTTSLDEIKRCSVLLTYVNYKEKWYYPENINTERLFQELPFVYDFVEAHINQQEKVGFTDTNLDISHALNSIFEAELVVEDIVNFSNYNNQDQKSLNWYKAKIDEKWKAKGFTRKEFEHQPIKSYVSTERKKVVTEKTQEWNSYINNTYKPAMKKCAERIEKGVRVINGLLDKFYKLKDTYNAWVEDINELKRIAKNEGNYIQGLISQMKRLQRMFYHKATEENISNQCIIEVLDNPLTMTFEKQSNGNVTTKRFKSYGGQLDERYWGMVSTKEIPYEYKDKLIAEDYLADLTGELPE